jgi:hypothetical protein
MVYNIDERLPMNRQTVVKIDRDTLLKIRDIGKKQVPPIKAPKVINKLVEFYFKYQNVK